MTLEMNYNPYANSYIFKYLISKNLVRNLYIVGSCDDWNKKKQFDLVSQDENNNLWILKLVNIYPFHEYKLIYEDHNNQFHWFNYMESPNQPAEK
jgi:hypothetical protein